MPTYIDTFENEKELQDWVFSNISHFFPDCILIPGFQITTFGGKRGVPDGFAFDAKNREWHIIENELIRHGVWPHIAEQVSRFIVASQAPETLRKVRDSVFEHLESNNLIHKLSSELSTDPTRLLFDIEEIILSSDPRITIFIDELNDDLQDFVKSLNSQVSIFRVQKLHMDGRSEYFSPDQDKPVIEESPDHAPPGEDQATLDALGGGRLHTRSRRFRAYELHDGRIINIKRSKLHERGNYYWYGLSASAREMYESTGVTDAVFQMGDRGFVVVGIDTLNSYLAETKTSQNADGSIRHYHILISNDNPPMLYWSQETSSFDLSDDFYSLD